MEKNNVSIRNSNFEVLRILCMFLIIAGHLTLQSGILNTNSANKIPAILLGSGYGIADNIFILISAFFLTDKAFNAKRIVKIYLEVALITIPLSIIMLLVNKSGLDLKDIVRSFFPYSGSPLWFATCYISMLLFSPFLNELLQKKEITKKILILLFFINVIPSTFLLRNDFFYSGEILYFCFLYLLVGYYKKYKIDFIERVNSKLALLAAILIIISLVGGYFIFELVGAKIGFIKNIGLSTYFIDRYHTLPSLSCSILIFIYVFKMKKIYLKGINTFAEGVFTAYVIHQTPTFAPFMWEKIFKVSKWLHSPNYILYYLSTVTIILVIGSIVGIFIKRIAVENIYKLSIFKKIEIKIVEFYKRGEKI